MTGRLYKRGSRWWCEFVDHRGAPRRVSTGMSDRIEAERFALAVARLVDLRRNGGQSMPADLGRWVESIGDRVRARLVAWGVVDRVALGRARSLAELVGEWSGHLRERGGTVEHARLSAGRVLRVLEASGIDPGASVGALDVEAVRDGLRLLGVKLAARTVNHHAGRVRQFSRWLVKRRLVDVDPMAALEPLPDRVVRADQRRGRRCLTDDELRRLLVSTAASGVERFGLSGPDRALAYELASGVGLRAGEVRRLRVEDLELDHAPPVLTVRNAKAERLDVVPILSAALVERLRGHCAGRDSGPVLAKCPRIDVFASMIMADLAECGIPSVFKGLVADFHALRHFFINQCARKAMPIQNLQKLARHAAVSTTLRYYTHLHVDDLARGWAMPDPRADEGPGASEAAG